MEICHWFSALTHGDGVHGVLKKRTKEQVMIFKRICFFIKVFWQVLKAAIQMMWGAWKLSRLPRPIVTVFGGHQVKANSPYARQAHNLAHKLIEENISVITGGGPGIMEAASCGATYEMQKHIQARSIGITIEGLSAEAAQACAQDYFVMSNLYARKWLMIEYSVAFAVFPGGFGTLNEMAEVLTLIQIKQLPGVPVVLIDKAYWKLFMEWIHSTAKQEGLISQEEVNLIRVTDDLDEAVMILKERCEICNIPVEKLKEKKG